MFNIFSKAIDEVMFTIPIEILEESFKLNSPSWRAAPISLSERIMNAVVRPRIIVDCNLVGGTMANIPLSGIPCDYFDTYSSVYRIPKERTNNLQIISALAVGYMPAVNLVSGTNIGYGQTIPVNTNNVSSVGQRIADSLSNVPTISTAYVELIADNTIMLRDQYRVTSVYFLRCILANDENMNNISTRSFGKFADLVKWAVKSYIYKTMIIKMDRAYLSGGSELGAFKSIIESYADAEENYQTFLNEKWRKTAVANDLNTYNRYIKQQISPGL